MRLKISRLQYFFMIPNLVYGKAIGITSGVFVRMIGIDTWTSMLIGFVIGIFIVELTAFMGKRFPEMTTVQYSEKLVGRFGGKLIGLVLALFFIAAFAVSADVLVLHLKEYFLPETPFIVVCVLYGLLSMLGVFLGFEVVVRISMIGFLMLVLLNITMVLGVIKDFDFMNLEPLFDKGLLTNITTSYYSFSDIAMIVLGVGMLFPTLNSKDKIMRITFWSMIVSTVIVIMWPFMETGVMGEDIMKKYVVVCMEQIRCAQFTKYLPRYELLMVSFFIFTIFVQSTAMLHCAKHSIKQITGIKKDWYIIVPITLTGIALSYFLANDHNDYINFLAYPWSQICAVLGIGLPLLLFFIALARGKLKKREEEQVKTGRKRK